MNFLLRVTLGILLCAFLAPALALLGEGARSVVADGNFLSGSLLVRYGSSSLVLVLGSVSGALVLGTSSAYLCARFEFPLRRMLLWLSILPLAVPSYLVAYSWVDFLVDLGIPGGQLRTMPFTCIVFAVCLAPYVFLPTFAALIAIPRSMIESARLLGQNRRQLFFSVEVPLAQPAIFGGAALAAMEVLADFGTVDFMAIDTWSTGIFRSWFGYDDRGRAALLAVALFFSSGIFLFWQTQSSARKSRAASTRQSAILARQRLHSLTFFPWFLLALVAPLLSMIFPALILVKKSFFESALSAWLEVIPATLTTLWISFSAAIIVVIFGLLFAAGLRVRTSRAFQFLLRSATLGYAFPGGVLGLGLFILLAPFSLTGSLFGVFFAYCVRFVTIGSTTIEARWNSIPKIYSEQARVLGCTERSAFLRVTLPLLRKSMACAFVLTCIDIVKELPATMLLRPFNFETLALRTYTLASDERLSETAPSSLMMVLLCLIGLLAAEKLGAFSETHRAESEQSV